MAPSDLFVSLPAKSFWFGILSAVSLPIGAILGIWLKPAKKVVAAILAFGAGSLLAALTLELVIPACERAGFLPLAIGAVTGGLLFVGLNYLLNGKGGFLRKPATLMRYLRGSKRDRMKRLVEHLSKVDLLRALPPDEMRALLHHVHPRLFAPGTVVVKEGGVGDSLYLIETGDVEVTRNGEDVAKLGSGDSFGEMSLLTGEPRSATVTASSEVRAWEVIKDDFDRLLSSSPALREALENLADQRLPEHADHKSWHKEVRRHVNAVSVAVTERDIREAAEAHGTGGAAFAIWLGILLDGIPESAVIGASVVHTNVSWALIAGLFMANLPEAMSSAVGMRAQKASVAKIIWMWTSLMLLTGIGALFGYLFFQKAPDSMFALFEGIAAGAMLVMVAETMLPEAYEQGGGVVGMSTLFGFLATLFVNSLGTH